MVSLGCASACCTSRAPPAWFPLRLVLARSGSCFSLIDLAICFEAPFSDDFERLASVAICRFSYLAGLKFTWCDYSFLRPDGLKGKELPMGFHPDLERA